MKRISTKTLMLLVAILAAWCAVVLPAWRARVPLHAVALVKATPGASVAALSAINRASTIAAALDDPRVAALPEVRGLTDPVAHIGRRLKTRSHPQSPDLIEITLEPANPAETAVVDAIAALSPAAIVTPATIRPGLPRPSRYMPAALLATPLAAIAILLILGRPRRMWYVLRSPCPTCGARRWTPRYEAA